MKKYKFRKMYFQTIDNQVITPGTEFTNAYVHKEYAEKNLEQRTTHYMWEDKDKPIPKRSVAGFYLVHESLYDLILKEHAKEDK